MDKSVINVALGKPATQSTTSRWSSRIAAAADASTATNGNADRSSYFHTELEFGPWWQVDLKEPFVIEEIRIYNRQECQERLRHFVVMTSLSGEDGSWTVIYRKSDDSVFGDGDFAPLIFQVTKMCLGRFVRIQLSEFGFLHFHRCEVFGRRPTSDEKKCERSKSILNGGAEAQQKWESHPGRNGYFVHLGNHRVFVDMQNYSRSIVQALTNTAYESYERQVISAVLRVGDRVLEAGTAVGVLTMLAASIVGPGNIFTFDANAAIVSDARANFKANGLEKITAVVGALRNRSRWLETEREVDFHVSRDFWASRLEAPQSDIERTERVPLFCLEDKIRDYRINVLICDIEGGEAELLIGADLSSIRLIIVETHYWVNGRNRIDSMVEDLIRGGFHINLDHSYGHLSVFDRG